MARPIEELTGPEIRAEMATTLIAREKLARTLRAVEDRAELLERRLLHDEAVAMSRSEGVVLESAGGVLRRHSTPAGRAFPNKDKIDELKGELPAELRPQPDRRVVVEHLSDLPSAIQVELLQHARPGEDGKAAVSVTDKTKYPTVAALRRAYGEETQFVGKPADVVRVVLEIPGDPPILLSREGMV